MPYEIKQSLGMSAAEVVTTAKSAGRALTDVKQAGRSLTDLEQRLGMGGMSAAEVISAVSSAGRALSDPYLPEAICRAKQLYAIHTGGKPNPCTVLPPNLAGGIGIRRAIKPMRGVVYAEQHTWVYPATVAVILGVPFLLGYLVGKR